MADDITGRTFGKLTAIRQTRYEHATVIHHGKASKHNQPTRFWLTRCTCGKELEVQQSFLTGGKVTCCPECKAAYSKKVNVVKKDTSNPVLYLDRSKFSNFKKYFEKNQYHFRDTFGYPYTEESVNKAYLSCYGITEIDGEKRQALNIDDIE